MRILESRLITVFILVMLIAQLAGFFPLRDAIESRALVAVDKELLHSDRIVERLLDQHTTKLTQTVMQLTSNAEFIEAINQSNRTKVVALLTEKSQQLNAVMGLLIDTDNRIEATTSLQLMPALKQASINLIAQAEQQGYATTILVNNHETLQLIGIDFKAPDHLGWVVMAFPLGKNFVSEFRQNTSLQISILNRDKQYWQVGSSSLNNSSAELLAKNIPTFIDVEAKEIQTKEGLYRVKFIELTPTNSPAAIIVVQQSMTDLLAPYFNMQIALLVLTVISLIVAIVGGVLFAKQVSQPLRHLSAIAQRLGLGDYASPINISGDKEIGHLAQAFVYMRDGFAQREHEIKRLAYWDTLTELPNRAQFTALLKKTITESNPAKQACFVLMMDLARFKHVNDIMGHSFGDRLLKKVAARLREALPDAHLARLGGDEFAMLLPNSTLSDAQASAHIILSQLDQPIVLEDQAVDLGAGIGLAGYPMHGDNAEMVLSRAEVAMYVAKRNIGNTFTIYSPEIDSSSQQNLSLLSELRSAIQLDQLRLFVQPKLALGQQHVVGVEALVRWEHPTRGFLVPDQFIPFAEQTGIIRLLTRWILNKSADLCADLIAHDIHLKVSVNISTHDLLDQDLPVKFADILTRHRVKTSSFCLEITESAIMNDPVRAQITLDRFSAMGVELSIDDFGTGYSSLAYLKRLPVSELKIDKSFVMDMQNNDDDRIIVKSTIDLGHNMGLRVVAEGVENAVVMDLLTSMGCDQAQGNYINNAIPAQQLIAWLADQYNTVS